MIPKLQLSATVSSRGCESLSRVHITVVRTVWLSSHLGCHRSAVWLSVLNVPPLTQTVAPMWELGPHPPKAGPVLLTCPFFSPSSLILPSFAWVYIFFSAVQVLLFALSWCSACASVSEGVLLMYPWREMYSLSTFSTILFFPPLSFDNHFSIFLTIWLGNLSINSDSSFFLASHQ